MFRKCYQWDFKLEKIIATTRKTIRIKIIYRIKNPEFSLEVFDGINLVFANQGKQKYVDKKMNREKQKNIKGNSINA